MLTVRFLDGYLQYIDLGLLYYEVKPSAFDVEHQSNH